MRYRTIVHIQVGAAIATIAFVAWGIANRLIAANAAPAPITATAGFYALPLAVAIFLAMWERGSSSDRIMGYKSTVSPTVIGAFLQNTVEQTLLALLAVATFSAYAPATMASVPVVAAWMHLIGRILFIGGYVISPMWRFYGFSINYYSSAALVATGFFFWIFGA